MALMKCPECGQKLSVYAKKCHECGTEVVICTECGSTYPKGTEICDMCGRELGKRKRRGVRQSTVDTFAPNDLVSIINGVKRRAVGYKVVRVLRIITDLIFWVVFALSVLLGLLFGGILINSAVALLSGESLGAVLGQLLHTVPKNAGIWWSFIKNILTPWSTAESIISFVNYVIAACMLPLIVSSAYYLLVYLPLDIAERIVCGFYVRRRGYNSLDTVAVLECPSLIYNSADSFDKAYTYFPFIEGCQGALAAVVSDLLKYLTGASYLLFGLVTVVCHGIVEVIVRTVVVSVLGLDAAVLLTVAAICTVLLFLLWIVAVSVAVGAIVKAVRGKQLKRWAQLYQNEQNK